MDHPFTSTRTRRRRSCPTATCADGLLLVCSITSRCSLLAIYRHTEAIALIPLLTGHKVLALCIEEIAASLEFGENLFRASGDGGRAADNEQLEKLPVS